MLGITVRPPEEYIDIIRKMLLDLYPKWTLLVEESENHWHGIYDTTQRTNNWGITFRRRYFKATGVEMNRHCLDISDLSDPKTKNSEQGWANYCLKLKKGQDKVLINVKNYEKECITFDAVQHDWKIIPNKLTICKILKTAMDDNPDPKNKFTCMYYAFNWLESIGVFCINVRRDTTAIQLAMHNLYGTEYMKYPHCEIIECRCRRR